MKFKIEIDTEEKKITKALFGVYVDMKKKELTKNQKFDILTKVNCDCKEKTFYKISVTK